MDLISFCGNGFARESVLAPPSVPSLSTPGPPGGRQGVREGRPEFTT